MRDRQGVQFTEYALLRMRQRDILPEEVLEVLDSRRSRHKGRPDGRSEVKSRAGKRRLLVVYRRADGATVIINAMWE